MGSFLAAVEFLTVVRLRTRRAAFDRASFAGALAWYGVVGALLGATVGTAWLLLDEALPPAPSTALAVALLAILTGALHLDGLGDSADGLLGGGDRASRLAIMRDTRLGSYGVVAITTVLVLKWSALLALNDGQEVFAALVACTTVARGGVVPVIALYPYARHDGLGAGLHEAARGLPCVAAVGTAALAGLALYGPAGFGIALAVIFAAVLVARYPYTRLGGLTGDIYGALIEMTEVATLLVAASGREHGWLEPWW